MNRIITEVFSALALITIFLVGPSTFALCSVISGEYAAKTAQPYMVGGLMSLIGVLIITLIPGCTIKIGQDSDDALLIDEEVK